MKKLLQGIAILAVTSMIFGCAGGRPGPNDFVYGEINFGDNRSDSYKSGAKAGCDTAKGDYRKNHRKFNNDMDYHEGWFDGRKWCQDPYWKFSL